MPVLTSLLIGTALVSSFQWLVFDGREDEAPPGSPPPSPWTSFANLRRHVSQQSEEERVEDQGSRREEEEEEVEQLPGYQRIIGRQRSFRKVNDSVAAKNLTTLSSSSRREQTEERSSHKEFPRKSKPLKPLFPKNVPSPPPPSQSTSSGARQPSLTLSDASTSSASPNPTTHHHPSNRPFLRSSYPLTPEQSQVRLPPVPNSNLQILPPQTINDAQFDEEDDVVASWLGSMEREGERVTCGAMNCEGKKRGACRCFEEGESKVRGRRLGWC
ncbi:hypothetical protein BDY24DRAFT_380848 [Mrakia frigida]|uniref:uncharacterized protein n=1 Tax=Mrakia frigida TaxID=29902 RepID=UPI003FCBF8C8